ncbi:MAG: hypothetical protein M3Q45_05015 [Chloroflexota bacterium]|nr:hypothetical protein [Chloroflexota bacterium]
MVIIFALMQSVALLIGVLVVGLIGYGLYRWLGGVSAWATASIFGIGMIALAVYSYQTYAAARNADEKVVATIFIVGWLLPGLAAAGGALWFVRLAQRSSL